MKVQLYQKATHTNQYLNVSSPDLLNHKLGVIRTCTRVHTCALSACGYPSWSLKRVMEQLDQWELKKNLKFNKENSKDMSTKTTESLCHMSGVFQTP